MSERKDDRDPQPTYAALFQDTPTAPGLIQPRPGQRPLPLAPGLLLAERFDIQHVTIQLEVRNRRHAEPVH